MNTYIEKLKKQAQIQKAIADKRALDDAKRCQEEAKRDCEQRERKALEEARKCQEDARRDCIEKDKLEREKLFESRKVIKQADKAQPKKPNEPEKRVRNESIFEEIKVNPDYSKERSLSWFRTKIQELSTDYPAESSALIATNRPRMRSSLLPGSLVFFKYDAKYKDTLPYWDKFPLSFIFAMDTTGFKGLNFHYLPYGLRIKLYDKMNAIAGNPSNQTMQIQQLTWQVLGNLSRFPEARPSVKQYLYGHVRSRFLQVELNDWKTAIMLPCEDFDGLSAGAVGRNSVNSMAQVRNRRRN